MINDQSQIYLEPTMPPRSMIRVTYSNHQFIRCPVCFDIPRTSVFQCVHGHIICEACFSLIDACPCCRERYSPDNERDENGNTIPGRHRALAVEQLLDMMTFECPNKRLGCQEMMKRQDIDPHLEIHCRYKYRHPNPDLIIQPDVENQQPDDSEALYDSIIEIICFLLFVCFVFLKSFLEAAYNVLRSFTDAICDHLEVRDVISRKVVKVFFTVYLIYLVFLVMAFRMAYLDPLLESEFARK